jgi:hypothetical protein
VKRSIPSTIPQVSLDREVPLIAMAPVLVLHEGYQMLRIRIRDPDPVPFWILDPDKKSRSGSGMNIPDNISESLDTIFWFKNNQFFDADPDPG